MADPNKQFNQAISVPVDKVSAKFSAAAQRYNLYDKVQRLTATRLLKGVDAKAWQARYILDIGSGPGTEFPLNACYGKHNQAENTRQVVALDIAPGMLHQLKSQYPDYIALCADAQALPLDADSVDLIYSNLALQWCTDLTSSLAEGHRVLRSQGELHCAVVAKGSLPQLRQLGLTVNAFHCEQFIREAMAASDWQAYKVGLVEFTLYFDKLRELLYSIKGVGASINAQPKEQDSSTGQGYQESTQVLLRGRGDWQRLQQLAEELRQPKGLPLTYQVAFIRGKKR